MHVPRKPSHGFQALAGHFEHVDEASSGYERTIRIVAAAAIAHASSAIWPAWQRQTGLSNRNLCRAVLTFSINYNACHIDSQVGCLIS